MNAEANAIIKRLKPAKQYYFVATQKERVEFLQEAAAMKRAGEIPFDVTSRKYKGGFKIFAV